MIEMNREIHLAVTNPQPKPNQSTTSHKQQQKMLPQGKKRARSAMRESVANTSEAISSDNLPTFVSNVPDMTSLSATSAPDSTGRDHASKPFWDAFSTEISKRLPSHTVTGSAASGSTSWSSSFARLAQGSWFSATEGAMVMGNPQTTIVAMSTSSIGCPSSPAMGP